MKEYKSEIGKDISVSVGETALSIALLSATFLKQKGLEEVATTISSEVGSKFWLVRAIAGGIAILSGGVWYECKLTADEARRIIKMTEDMLETLSNYIDRGYWKEKNYLMISYDRKDGTSAVKFGKHKDINYSVEEHKIQSEDFAKLSQDSKVLLNSIKKFHTDYQKQLEMKRSNKWYKTFVTVGPDVLLGVVFPLSAVGKLLEIFKNGRIPTKEEFNDIISGTGFDGEFPEKAKAKIIKNYNKAYGKLYKEGSKNPIKFINMSIKNLSQIQDYNKSVSAF